MVGVMEIMVKLHLILALVVAIVVVTLVKLQQRAQNVAILA